MGVVKSVSTLTVKFHDNCFFIHLFAFNHKSSSPEHWSKPWPLIWRPKHHPGQHNSSKDGIIHRMTTSIHRQAVSDTERPAVILLFIQRNKYGWFKESQSMMKAIWHPETASITPQAQKQQSISLPMKDNLLQEQSGHNDGRCMQKKKKLYTTSCYTFLNVLLTVRQRSFIVSKRRMRKRNISLGRTTSSTFTIWQGGGS